MRNTLNTNEWTDRVGLGEVKTLRILGAAERTLAMVYADAFAESLYSVEIGCLVYISLTF